MPTKINRAWSYLIFAASCVLLGLGVTDDNAYARPSTPPANTAMVSTLLTGSSHLAGPGRQCGVAWRAVPVPNIWSLRDIEVITASDIWAGGERGLLHWNGENWTQVPIPVPGYVMAISSISSDDVWAVGYAGFGDTLTLHWDGQSWTHVPSPNGRNNLNSIYGVSAISRDDVWAVGGSAASPSASEGLLLHWDGNTWNTVPNSEYPAVRFLAKVVAVATNDVWAVSAYGLPGDTQPLIIHWDGSAWQVSPTPKVEPNGALTTLYAVSADDIWAGGFYNSYHTLTLHWDGTAWNNVSAPDVETITDITLLSSNKVLALGTSVLQWDGSAWGIHSDPDSDLEALGVLGSDDIWAVGQIETPYERISLMRHYTTQPFADVPPGNGFYAFTRCLACRGIISGYTDGTFRPNNGVTRGQLAIMVSNAAGLTADPGSQIFEDVVPGTTYYNWVQRLANRGIIGGYPCGGAGEPCGSGNRPYFRPTASATRGQISKIVSEARGYTEPVSGQIFEDVSPPNSFYVYVERLASRGIMGGYQCGGTGEPCGEGNRPYFRPDTDATRGQVSKIVANTFFPGCETQVKP